MSNPSFEEPTSPLGGDPDRTRSTAPLAGTPRPAVAPAIPARIGRYTIVRVLGEGGMGTVYEAEQDQPKRAVAMKVIRAGYLSPQLLKRFEHESAVLGRLQHPGIAQVYEAGTVQDERGHPVPFFAMEFIRGVPLTEYAASKNLGTRERLELVARICDAVYHAHQKGVIHRDLKPGNILVDDSGQPKILDFGVARATDSDVQHTMLQTGIGQLIGTVPYMSPEQVGGDPVDLDTRSDVYAMGVIAYELLAGRLPYDLSRMMIAEAARIIKEEEPTRLSSINRTLRGDVETIVSKALEKDKVRRYQSAESLASDIRRYLKDEPIAARPASTWYQVQKFSRRNTGLVIGVAAAFVFLVAGLFFTISSRNQAVSALGIARAATEESNRQKDAAVAAKNSEAQQRRAADKARTRAETINRFVKSSLQASDPELGGKQDATIAEAMTAAIREIESGAFKDDPETEAELLRTIGEILNHNGRSAEAEPILRRALEMHQTLNTGDSPSVVDSLGSLGLACATLGRELEAESLQLQSLEMARRLFSGDHSEIAHAIERLANARSNLGKHQEADALHEESLEMRRRLFPGDSADVATSMYNLALSRQDLGREAEAEQLLRQVLESRRRMYPGDDPSIARTLAGLATVLDGLGRAAEAEPLMVEALEMVQRIYKGDHPSVADQITNLAAVQQSMGREAEAETNMQRALDMHRRLFNGDHPRGDEPEQSRPASQQPGSRGRGRIAL